LNVYRAIRQFASFGLASVGLGMVSAFGLKALFTISSFALLTLAAHALGIETFGNYSLLFSAAGILGVVATFGQQLLVIRFWNEYLAEDRADLLKGSLLFSTAVCVIGGLIVGVPFYIWCTFAYSPSIGMAVACYLTAMSLVMTTSHLVRTAVGVEAGDGFGTLLLIVPAITYLGFCLVSETDAELEVLFLVMAVGGAAGGVIHVLLMARAIATKFPEFHRTRATFELSLWMGRSARLWVSNALEAANQYLDVLVIAYLIDPAVAGAYFVVSRVANIPAAASDAINMFATRHIPDLYYRKQLTQLVKMLDAVALVTVLVVVASILLVILGGSPLLSVFNSAYAVYHGVLIVLTIGTAAVVASGPSASILMLTGHEGRCLAIVGGTVLLRTVGLVALVPLFGIMGGAVATTAALVVMALLLRHAVRDCTGIDGSVARLLPSWRGGRLVRMADQ
jgi:O-antigen/teichoic acid export membrane protein